MKRTAALALLSVVIVHAASFEDVRVHIPKVESRPAPTALKSALRAWAESQFLHVRDPLPLSGAMNNAIERAGLAPALGKLTLFHPSGEKDYLVLVTRPSVSCGVDGSAYLYQWIGDRWKSLLASETAGPPDAVAPVYDPSLLVRLSTSRRSERVFTLGGAFQWCSSNWHTVYYKAWLLQRGEPALLLDRAQPAYLAEESFDMLVDPTGIAVQLVVSHPNPDILTAVIREEYVRTGARLDLVRRTPVTLLEDLDEETNDPVRYLLQWIEERIAPQGDLAWRVKELNAKLARFQFPKAARSARIEIVPSANQEQATLILHTPDRQTRRTVTNRNGQWEMSRE